MHILLRLSCAMALVLFPAVAAGQSITLPDGSSVTNPDLLKAMLAFQVTTDTVYYEITAESVRSAPVMDDGSPKRFSKFDEAEWKSVVAATGKADVLRLEPEKPCRAGATRGVELYVTAGKDSRRLRLLPECTEPNGKRINALIQHLVTTADRALARGTSVKPKITKEDGRKAIAELHAGSAACREHIGEGLKRKAVKVTMIVKPDGTMRDVVVDEIDRESPLAKCLRSVGMAIELPATEATTDVPIKYGFEVLRD